MSGNGYKLAELLKEFNHGFFSRAYRHICGQDYEIDFYPTDDGFEVMIDISSKLCEIGKLINDLSDYVDLLKQIQKEIKPDKQSVDNES